MTTETLPPTLYHYTSQSGLLGIISKKQIWATDISFLNDTMEYKYAVDLALDIIEEYKEASIPVSKPLPKYFSTEDQKPFIYERAGSQYPIVIPVGTQKYGKDFIEYNMLDDLCNLIKCYTNRRVFVFSLSKEGNLLSQWRGYCPDSHGYSIGFKTSVFKELIKNNGCKLVKCIYNKSAQKALIRSIVDAFAKNIDDNLKTLLESNGDRVELVASTVIEFTNIAPILKDDAFIEEEEWRVVYVQRSGADRIAFREGKSTIVPYVKISIHNEGNTPIEKITTSPTSHEQLSVNAVKSLLFSNGINDCPVDNSNIPLN